MAFVFTWIACPESVIPSKAGIHAGMTTGVNAYIDYLIGNSVAEVARFVLERDK